MKDALNSGVDKVIQRLGTLNHRFSGKTILITGAAGFLGRHFVSYFLLLNDLHKNHEPCTIIAWDNLIRKDFEDFGVDANRVDVTFTETDIIQAEIDFKVDFIIHAASIASPVFYRKHPIETMDANVLGTRTILEYCKKNEVSSFLHLSSSEVYGNPPAEQIPTAEDYWGNVNTVGPRACYDESKRYAETLCVNFFRAHKVPVKIVRPFNVYGPGLSPNDGRVMSDFFKGALLHKEIQLFSDGTATRTFCYITDALEGFLRALLSDYNGEIFNIGTAQPEVSMTQLATMVKEVCNNGTVITYTINADPDYVVDNPTRRCPVISKANQLLGYEPCVTLEEGLKTTFNYYSNMFSKQRK